MTRLRMLFRPAIDSATSLLPACHHGRNLFLANLSRCWKPIASQSRPLSTTGHHPMPNDLLIASLGNPSPAYDRTRHSAGHTLLHKLASHLGEDTLAKEGREWARGKVARYQYGDAKVVLWQAPGYMNECGPTVLSAWREFCAREVISSSKPHLVVLHDEIEELLGKFKIRRGSGYGARGHNGLRSILKIAELAKLDTTRVAIGVGPRPKSKEPDVVADFVMKKMSPAEMEKLEGMAEDVWRLLESRLDGDEK